MLPGPVPMPERVRYAMMRQAINHRSAEFGAAYADCVRVLKSTFGTANDLFVISGSGTAGMEAAIANVGKDKQIACITNGKFGERLLKISQRYGKAHEIKSEWGTPVNLEALKHSLRQEHRSSPSYTTRHQQVSKTRLRRSASSAGSTMPSSSWTASPLSAAMSLRPTSGCRYRYHRVPEVSRCTGRSCHGLRKRQGMGAGYQEPAVLPRPRSVQEECQRKTHGDTLHPAVRSSLRSARPAS